MLDWPNSCATCQSFAASEPPRPRVPRSQDLHFLQLSFCGVIASARERGTASSLCRRSVDMFVWPKGAAAVQGCAASACVEACLSMLDARISTTLPLLCAYVGRRGPAPPRMPHAVGVVMLCAPRAVPAGELKVSISICLMSATLLCLSPLHSIHLSPLQNAREFQVGLVV